MCKYAKLPFHTWKVSILLNWNGPIPHKILHVKIIFTSKPLMSHVELCVSMRDSNFIREKFLYYSLEMVQFHIKCYMWNRICEFSVSLIDRVLFLCCSFTVVKNCPVGKTGTICNYLYSALWLGLTRINSIVRASALISSLRSWVRFLLRTHDTYVKRVNHRFTESRGFSPRPPLSSQRESWQSGLG
jgi:hypothetical protein